MRGAGHNFGALQEAIADSTRLVYRRARIRRHGGTNADSLFLAENLPIAILSWRVPICRLPTRSLHNLLHVVGRVGHEATGLGRLHQTAEGPRADIEGEPEPRARILLQRGLPTEIASRNAPRSHQAAYGDRSGGHSCIPT